jgi:hypothetical protein
MRLPVPPSPANRTKIRLLVARHQTGLRKLIAASPAASTTVRLASWIGLLPATQVCCIAHGFTHRAKDPFGHSSLGTTERHYVVACSRLAGRALAEIVEKQKKALL